MACSVVLAEAAGFARKLGRQADAAPWEEMAGRFFLPLNSRGVILKMMSAPLGLYAARLGDRRLSARLFQEGYAEFINEPYTETNEFSVRRYPDKPQVGPGSPTWVGSLSAASTG